MTQNGPKLPPNGPKMTPGFTHFFRNFFYWKDGSANFFAFRMYDPKLFFRELFKLCYFPKGHLWVIFPLIGSSIIDNWTPIGGLPISSRSLFIRDRSALIIDFLLSFSEFYIKVHLLFHKLLIPDSISKWICNQLCVFYQLPLKCLEKRLNTG